MSNNGKTDELIRTIGIWQIPPPPGDKWVYVYDRYWVRSKVLYEQVKNASWDDVILNEGMKEQITSLMHKFFDSKDIYKNLGVPWKRGVIFYGESPPVACWKSAREPLYVSLIGVEIAN